MNVLSEFLKNFFFKYVSQESCTKGKTKVTKNEMVALKARDLGAHTRNHIPTEGHVSFHNHTVHILESSLSPR
jgi:hypothetical protein